MPLAVLRRMLTCFVECLCFGVRLMYFLLVRLGSWVFADNAPEVRSQRGRAPGVGTVTVCRPATWRSSAARGCGRLLRPPCPAPRAAAPLIQAAPSGHGPMLRLPLCGWGSRRAVSDCPVSLARPSPLWLGRLDTAITAGDLALCCLFCCPCPSLGHGECFHLAVVSL